MQSAIQGVFYSQRKLAFEYASKKQDLLSSIEWYESATLGGDREAMHNLGLIYAAEYKLVKRNTNLAIILLENSKDYLNDYSRRKLAELKKELGSSM